MIWHVDNLKASHISQEVLKELVNQLNSRYCEEKLTTVHWGSIQNYLEIEFDFTQKRKVIISMKRYIQRMLKETSEDMEGSVTMPAAYHLYHVDPDAPRLDKEIQKIFYHTTA